MTKRTSKPDRAVGVLADLTGRSDAEIKLILGVALTTAGIAIAIRTLRVLIDIGPRPQSTRTVRSAR